MPKENEAGFGKNIDREAVKPVRILLVDDNSATEELVKFSGKRIDLSLDIKACDDFSSGLEELLNNQQGFDLAVLDKSGGVGSNRDEKLYKVILNRHSLFPKHEYPLTDLIIRLVEKNTNCKILINSRSSYIDRSQYIPEELENLISFGDKTGHNIDSWLAKNTGKFEIHYKKLIDEDNRRRGC
jgi:hypothetical protein